MQQRAPTLSKLRELLWCERTLRELIPLVSPERQRRLVRALAVVQLRIAEVEAEASDHIPKAA